MNDDPVRDPLMNYSYDSGRRVTRVPSEESVASPMGRHAEPRDPPVSPAFAVEHDADQGVFRITWPDGKVEVFRDKPARQLCVEPDEAGVLRPVVQRGRPAYLFLCREEREVR